MSRTPEGSTPTPFQPPPSRPLRLGFFFTYWSNTKTTIVASTPPVPLDTCPFCRQQSDAIIKIYNTKTRHYSAFSIGKGKFQATFTCRMCTNEGRLDPRMEAAYVQAHLVGQKYSKIMDGHNSKPDKAKRQLEDLIRKNPDTMITDDMRQKLNEWRRGGHGFESQGPT